MSETTKMIDELSYNEVKKKKNIYKAIAGASLVGVGVLGYVLYRQKNDYKMLKKGVDLAHRKADMIAKALTEGVFEDSITSVSNKINYIREQLELLDKNDLANEELICKLEEEMLVLARRGLSFCKAQESLGITGKH